MCRSNKILLVAIAFLFSLVICSQSQAAVISWGYPSIFSSGLDYTTSGFYANMLAQTYNPYTFTDYTSAWGLNNLAMVGPLMGLGGGLYGLYGGYYGLGGLYGGLGGYSLYGGLYGMYGGLYGGLYGLYGGLYGLGRFGLSNNFAPLTRTADALLIGATPGGGVALPDPTGSWSGTWLSYINLRGGICNMNLVYDPLTLTVSGTAGLLLNKLIPIPIAVAGLNSATGFTLSGSYLDPIDLVTYYMDLTCTLVSPTFMTGDYSIHDLLYTRTDLGEMNVSLVPVI